MSLIGIVHLAERLLNQTRENDANAQSNGKHAVRAHSAQNDDGDQFTPSAQNAAQDAGLFRVSNISLFSAAADFVFEQPVAHQAPAANVNGATQNASGDAAQSAEQNAGVAASATPAANENVAAAATDGTAPTAAASQAVAPAISSASANPANDTTAELRNLNSTLASLGLSQAEINVVDRIAQLVRDFNPQAFNDLINQLQALAQANGAQNAAQVSAQPAAQTAQQDSSPAARADSQTGAAGGNTGFSIDELSIKFAGVEGTTQLSKNGKNAGTAEFSAYNLQVEEVQITFGNGAGQTAQIRAPQTPAASDDSPAQPQGKAANA